MATRIPINKDNGYGFEDRQKKIWEEMETDMDRRRREWEDEIEKMRREFFMLRPEGEERSSLGAGGSALPLGLGGERLGARSRLLETTSADDSRGMVVKDDKGNPVFKVLFDVHDYQPEEVSVKMDANKIMVSARHEATQGGSSVSREYSREVKIPNELDPMTLQCTMGPDGILAVEAPLPVPKYAAVKDDSTSLPVKTGSPGGSGTATPLSSTSSASYQTSSTYQTGPRGANSTAAEVTGPPGFKSVSAPFQNSVPAACTLPTSSFASSAQPTLQQQHVASSVSSAQSSFRDAAPLPVPAYSKVSPPFQPFSTQQPSSSSYSPPLKPGSVGRIGSPVVSQDRDGKFKMEIDIEDFKPDELTVKTQDRKVVVCARREEKTGNRTSTRELSREHTLPDAVDPLTIKAFFTDGGKLIVEAPYRDAAPAQITGR